MFETNTVNSLCMIPATDCNFKSVLKRASGKQIAEAIKTMRESNGKHKGRILACERELRQRAKNGTENK